MNYYPHHIGDYAKDTSHLSMVEDGAYRRLLDIAYTSERPLPLEPEKLYRLARARSHAERAAVDVVLGEFFDKRASGWHHKRVEEEIEKGNARISAARLNGKMGGRPKNPDQTQQEPGGLSLGNPAETQVKAPNPITQRTTTTPLPPSGAFLRFWTAWPKSARKASRGPCWDRWRKANLDQVADQVIAHVESMKLSIDWRKDSGAFIPAPLVYLNQSRWDGADAAGPAEKRMVM